MRFVHRDSLIGTLIAFAVLAGWILTWPASGEGDAVLHYLDSRLAVAGDTWPFLGRRFASAPTRPHMHEATR